MLEPLNFIRLHQAVSGAPSPSLSLSSEFFFEFLDEACAHLINVTDDSFVPIWHEVTPVEPEIYHGLGSPMQLPYDRLKGALGLGQFVTELRGKHGRAALILCKQLEEVMIPETELVVLIAIFEKLVNSKIGHANLWQFSTWIGMMFDNQIHVQKCFFAAMKFHNRHVS